MKGDVLLENLTWKFNNLSVKSKIISLSVVMFILIFMASLNGVIVLNSVNSEYNTIL